ncbi:hypothetical protein V6N13_087364 [Hibiscus sabdariffa]
MNAKKFSSVTPHGYHGVDKQGHPVYIERIAQRHIGRTSTILDVQGLVTGNKFHNKLLEIIDPRLLGMTLTGGIFMLAKKLQAFVTRKMNLVAAACVVNKLSCFV